MEKEIQDLEWERHNMEMNDKKNTGLTVKTLGGFSIQGMGGHLKEDGIRSEMLIKLMAYIFCHHTQEMTVQELTDVLWTEEGSDNPAGALKNLMYRLRLLLKKTWGPHDFILTGQGAYSWNKEIPLDIDAEDFDKGCKQASREQDTNQKIEDLKQALSYYQGTFLPKFSSEYWIMALSTYYQGTYLSAVKTLADLLGKEQRYKEMARWCTVALQYEPLDEDIHTDLIKALIGQNKLKMAMDHYKDTEALLYENLGVAPSDELRRTYEALLKETNSQQMDLKAIEEELTENNESGAFLCDFGVFKKTYNLEMRRAARLGLSVFVVLITVGPAGKMTVASPNYLEVINDGMDRLERVLLGCLRSGDVISRYSGAQFIILLPTCQYETTKMVIQRIEDNFYETGDKQIPKVKLHYSLDEMDEK